jgi:hypothetical protein
MAGLGLATLIAIVIFVEHRAANAPGFRSRAALCVGALYLILLTGFALSGLLFERPALGDGYRSDCFAEGVC